LSRLTTPFRNGFLGSSGDEGVERKLVAIVAADVAGYVAMLAEDEAGTIASLENIRCQAFQPNLQASNGEMVRFMGDGTLILFASGVGAVNFSLAVQQAVAKRRSERPGDRPILFRIGVAIGDIVGDEKDYHGDGINLAFRLQTMAQPGGICLSQSVFANLPQSLGDVFQPLGMRRLKHIRQPIAVWRWPLDAAGSAPPSASIDNGHQILDPKVTKLLVQLHMRSARLALSDAIDEILTMPAEGRDLDIAPLYSRLGEHLNRARAMLAPILIECEYDARPNDGAKPTSVPMSEFLANVFDDAQTAYAMRLLPVIQGVLRSQKSRLQRRRELMELLETFMQETMIMQTMSKAKYAFVPG
jgi:class 3 adenylate cyclase